MLRHFHGLSMTGRFLCHFTNPWEAKRKARSEGLPSRMSGAIAGGAPLPRHPRASTVASTGPCSAVPSAGLASRSVNPPPSAL
ncbi:hypothetical protein B7760_04116 [Burkholderia glumae]|nr:hypothetical protein B7760_04116 [Burkholderia glumae]